LRWVCLQELYERLVEAERLRAQAEKQRGDDLSKVAMMLAAGKGKGKDFVWTVRLSMGSPLALGPVFTDFVTLFLQVQKSSHSRLQQLLLTSPPPPASPPATTQPASPPASRSSASRSRRGKQVRVVPGTKA